MPVLFKSPTPSQIILIKNAKNIIFHYWTNEKIPQVPSSGNYYCLDKDQKRLITIQQQGGHDLLTPVVLRLYYNSGGGGKRKDFSVNVNIRSPILAPMSTCDRRFLRNCQLAIGGISERTEKIEKWHSISKINIKRKVEKWCNERSYSVPRYRCVCNAFWFIIIYFIILKLYSLHNPAFGQSFVSCTVWRSPTSVTPLLHLCYILLHQIHVKTLRLVAYSCHITPHH